MQLKHYVLGLFGTNGYLAYGEEEGRCVLVDPADAGEHLIRELKRLTPPVGVFFETDNLYTLSENSELMLSFLATFAQEESVKKSEAMTWSESGEISKAPKGMVIQNGVYVGM